MDYSKLTLGELLSSDDNTIKRNAISILKQLHKEPIHKEPKQLTATDLINIKLGLKPDKLPEIEE